MIKDRHDLVFIEMLDSIKKLSDDKKRQVASLIVNETNDIISFGSNSLPDGVLHKPKRCERPDKYVWLLHAERNAIYKAARLGISLKGAKMYCTYFPCVDCARAIIQAGIVKLYTEKPDLNHPTWGDSWINAMIMFKECGVEIVWTNEIDPTCSKCNDEGYVWEETGHPTHSRSYKLDCDCKK